VLRVLLVRYDEDDLFAGDADIEMAALVAAGNAAARGQRIMRARLAAGDKAGAALACKHGWGYDTTGSAATDAGDPRAGTAGFRCLYCGSWFKGKDASNGRLNGRAADAPCELEPRR